VIDATAKRGRPRKPAVATDEKTVEPKLTEEERLNHARASKRKYAESRKGRATLHSFEQSAEGCASRAEYENST